MCDLAAFLDALGDLFGAKGGFKRGNIRYFTYESTSTHVSTHPSWFFFNALVQS